VLVLTGVDARGDDPVDLDVEEGDQVGHVLLVLRDVAHEFGALLVAEQGLELGDRFVELDDVVIDRPVLGVDVDEVVAGELGEIEVRGQALEDEQALVVELVDGVADLLEIGPKLLGLLRLGPDALGQALELGLERDDGILDAEILADGGEEVREIPADVDLVFIAAQELLGLVGVELDLEAPALGVPLAETGQDEAAVLLDEVAADVDEHGIFGQVLDDGFLEVIEEGFVAGDEIGDALVRRRVEDRIARREEVEGRAAAELEVEVLEDALIEIVEEDGLEGRKSGRIQLGELFHFVHGVDLCSARV
jgi:hypothetical protein